MNKLTRMGMVLIVALSLCGCVGVAPDDLQMAARPTQTVDEFTGTTRETMTTAPFGGEMDGARVFLTLIHETTRDGKPSTRLCANYKGFGEWLFIEPGASLIFLIDGQTEELRSAEGSTRFREVDGRNVRERAYYPLSMDLCRRIGQAQTVKLRLIGRSYKVDKTFAATTQKTFTEFADKFTK
jgi:hypothetical protein